MGFLKFFLHAIKEKTGLQAYCWEIILGEERGFRRCVCQYCVVVLICFSEALFVGCRSLLFFLIFFVFTVFYLAVCKVL